MPKKTFSSVVLRGKNATIAIDRLKLAYGFKTDKQLSNHFAVPPQSITNARKKIPSDWLFRCHEDTGASIDWLLDLSTKFKGEPKTNEKKYKLHDIMCIKFARGSEYYTILRGNFLAAIDLLSEKNERDFLILANQIMKAAEDIQQPIGEGGQDENNVSSHGNSFQVGKK